MVNRLFSSSSLVSFCGKVGLAAGRQIFGAAGVRPNLAAIFNIRSAEAVFAAAPRRCYGTAMKYRYLYFVAAGAFLVVALVALFASQNYLAAAVNGGSGLIFLFLGISPPQRPPAP